MTPLATAAELNTHLQRTVPADQAELALAGSSGAVRAYCRWGISSATETLYADGDGASMITLPTLLLTDVTEIRVENVPVDLVTLPYPIWSRNGQIFYGGLWTKHAKVEVDCTHGFDPVPDLVRLVVLSLAARAIANPEGTISARVGSVQRTWATSNGQNDMTELHMRLLDQYRI